MAASSNTPTLVVETVRVMVHTVGPIAFGGQLSSNHWSKYLLVQSGCSVHL